MTPLQARRSALRVPKKEIGRRLDADPYLYGRIEGGSVAPSGRTVAAIATLLGTPASELFSLRACECGCGTPVPVERRFAHGHDDTKGPQARRYWQEQRRRQGIPELKTCVGCGAVYSRRKRENTRKWLKRRWCSKECWRESPICRTPPHQRRWV